MKRLRKEDLSLHHFIRYNILNEYIETEYTAPLDYLPDVSEPTSQVYQADSNMIPLPTELGRGWVYIDNYGEFKVVYPNIINALNHLLRERGSVEKQA